jgi:hypothetical protein
MPMEVLNAGERRTHEIFALDFPLCLWVPPQADESSVHDQETDLPGLLQMWSGI